MFEKVITYEFEVDGERFAASQIDIMVNRDNLQLVSIQETRKNGQEDCHMQGCVVRDKAGDPWRWDDLESGGEMFDEYLDDGAADAILQFMNSHDFPTA